LGTSEFESVQLSEKLFDALTHLIALGVERVNFFLKALHQIALLIELAIEDVDALFGGSAGLALALDKTDGARDAVFERGEIGAAESQIALMVVIHFRVFDVFRDLGFQR
jgi:hypothetical protein